MDLCHMLTRSGLALPDVSSVVSPGFFCLLVCSWLLSSVIFYTGKWKNYIMESLMNCTAHQILFGLSKENEMAENAARMVERKGMYRVLVGMPEGKRSLGRPMCRWDIILRWISRKWDGWTWTGLIWLRIGTGNAIMR